MVPHVLVEEALQDIVDQHLDPDSQEGGESQVAVTAVPDEAKGEKLIVVHGPLPIQPTNLIDQLRSKEGLPNLWIPRADSFIEVPQIPTLGTGKVDLKALKRIATDAYGKDTG